VPFQDPPACRARDWVTPGDRSRPGAGERSAASLLGNLAAEVTARGRTNRDLCPIGVWPIRRSQTPGSADERMSDLGSSVGL
jgi:hypothetical protein